MNNPWRVVGFTTMQAEVDLHEDIANFIHVDAEGSDDKQISDINGLLANGDCDILIVSPNTTAALTPVVETACEQLPVIVFDRGVNTDCPVTFIQPIGGYAFGAAAANFIVDQLPDGGNVLALRILPGVDVLEHRWAGADAHLRRRRADRRGRRVHRGLHRQHQVDRRGLHPAFRRDRRDLDGRGRHRRSPRSRRSRTSACPTRSSPVKTSRTSWSSGKKRA